MSRNQIILKQDEDTLLLLSGLPNFAFYFPNLALFPPAVFHKLWTVDNTVNGSFLGA